MALLESAMAFAVVMMIFSTIVTGIVEGILSLVLHTREKDLKQTVTALFDEVIWPRLETRLRAAEPDPAAVDAQENQRKKFVEKLTHNPIFATRSGRLMKFTNRNKGAINELSVLSFAERLGKTDVGKAIVEEAANVEAKMDLMLHDFARSYERFGRSATEVFSKKAQLTAICVAVPFALLVNIDASRLINQLINNPEIRTELIAQAEEAHEQNAKAVDSLEALTTRLQKLDADTKGRDKPLPDAHLEKIRAELNATVADVRRGVDGMKAQGLAVGWDYFPYCAEGPINRECTSEDNFLVTLGRFVLWVVMCIIAGGLIGLGGPFWFKVFSGLSKAFNALRSMGIVGKKPPADAKRDTTPSAEESAKPKDVLDAFKVSAGVRGPTPPPAEAQ